MCVRARVRMVSKRSQKTEYAPPSSYLRSEMKIAWRNISNLRYADDTTLMAESEEKLKCLLMKVKEES